MKERAHSFRSHSGSQTHPGDARKWPGTRLEIPLEIPGFRPRHAALILVALALAIAVSYSILIAPFALAQEEGTVALSPAQPVVGAAQTATLADPDGTISATTWQRANSSDWDASAETETETGIGTWSDSSGATSASYTPVTGDEGKYLRAAVSYTDGQGAGNSAQGVSANKVPPKKPTGLSAARGPGSGQVSLTHVAPGGGFNNPTGGTARVAAQATEIDLWSATLTVGKHSDNEWYGFGTDSSGTYGSIDSASFMTGGTTYNIRSLISSQDISGQAVFIRILNSPGFRNVMTLTVGGRDFEGSAATTSSGNTGFSWPTNPAFTWAEGDTVSVSLKATLPGAPANVSAEAGDSEVALSWDDPSDDTITKYQYRQKEGSGDFGNWTDITGSGATTTTHTVTGLTGGTAYSFQVRAAVATLAGAASGTVTATPAAWIQLWLATLTVGKNSDNEWYGFGGNSDNTTYGAIDPASFTYNGVTYNIDVLVLDQSGDTLYFTAGFLLTLKDAIKLTVGGRSFSGTAASISSGGDGFTWPTSPGLTWAVGEKVAVSLKAIRPFAPANFKAEAGDSEVALSWDDPSDDTITKYQYRQKEGSGGFGNWTDITGSGATTTSHTVTSLTNGTAYSFQVRAAVATLLGVESGTVTATPVAQIEFWSATMTVGKDSDNPFYGFGTDTVTNATYGTIAPNSFIYDGTTYNITSLVNVQEGLDFLFFEVSNSIEFQNVMTLTVGGRSFTGSAITSTQDDGNGFTWSDGPYFTWAVGDTVAVSLKAILPVAPANFKAVAGDSEVALSWDDPSDDTITKYQYRQKEGSGGFGNWTDITGSGATTTSHTVTSLTNGTAYSFQVRAAVATLLGVESGTVTATPAAYIELWSATLTVGKRSGQNEFGFNNQFEYGSLSPNRFTHGGQLYTFPYFSYLTGGSLTLSFFPNIPFKSVLTLVVDDEEFSVRDGTSFSSSMFWADHGLTWAVGEKVAVSLKAIRPVAPANFKAVAGDSAVALSWDDPSDDTITKYQYRQKTGSGGFGNWTDITGSGATTTTHTVTSLTNGTAYSFQVRAAVATLAGVESGTATATPSANRAPAFATETATLGVAENTAEGDDVGAPVAATDEDNDTLTYSLSGVDAASFAISGSTGQITVGTGASLDYETTKSYSVIVSVHDGKDADGNADTTVDDTITVTINVTNVDEAGAVALSPAQPVVGTALTAALTDPDGTISAATWVWASSTDGSTAWTDISGATSASYTPLAEDVGKYLRATVTYTDGHGSGKSAQAESDIPVVVLPPKPSGLAATAGLERVTLSWEDPGDSSITGYEYYQAAELAKLTATDRAGGDQFGFSVSVDGDTMVVGADRDDDNGADSGSAYVFVRPASGDWSEARQVAKLTASDGAAGDRFGTSVSVDGDTIVVGANGDDDSGSATGSAYVFVRPSAGWATTTETAKLTASDGARNDNFGYSISVDGETVIVGAYGDNDNGSVWGAGSAYVFVRPSAGWATATETAKLTASDGVGGDQFGRTVSVDGDTVVVGVYLDDDNGADSGSAYVFVRPSTGWAAATETAKLTASDGAPSDSFGWSVSVGGDTVVVGADGDGSVSGSAYVFVRPSTGWATATETAKLTASDGAVGDQFGASVSVEEDTVVVGALNEDASGINSGSAYVFVRPATGWATATEAVKLAASDGAANDKFGYSISVDGETVIVGAYGDDDDNDDGDDDGSAYVFAAGGWARIGGSGTGTVEHTVEELDVGTEYTFSIRALNGGGPGPASLSVTATPFANRDPGFATATADRTVEENTAAGENIGESVTAADPDSGDTLVYSLSGVDAAAFAIGSSTGQITVGTGASLDYETTKSYSVIVSVSDGKDADGNADTAVDDTISVTINVTNVDEAGAVTLPPAQPVVGTALTATLTDPDGTISAATWVWAGSSDWDATTQTGTWSDISGATLASYTPVAGDVGSYLRVSVAYTDGAGAGKSATGVSANTVMAATPVNQDPAFADDTAIRSIAENSALNTNVGSAVTTTDPDSGDTLAYSLSGTDAASFAIGASTGQITVGTGASLDYESKASYTVTVSVSDGRDADGNADTTVDDTIAVTINVTNEDEAGAVTLPPAQPVVGTALTATLTDPDGTISAATWVWAGSSDWDASAETGTWSDISGATSASYTPVAEDVGKYLRATASYTDGHGAGKTAQAVSANTVMAAPPVNQDPAFADDTAIRSIAENSALNTNVGSAVTTTDPDSGDTLTYSLSGTDAASFAIGASTGQITVGTGASLDYETANSYSVTVSVSDGKDADGNADTTVDDTISVTINVTNVEEAGSVILSPTQPVVGTALTATLTDPDGSISGAAWVWAGSSDWDASAETGTWSDISGATLASYTPVAGDVGSYLRVSVAYTDGHGAGKSAQAVSANIVMAAPPVNQDPAFADDTAARSVAENTAAGESIGGPVSAADPDTGDTLVYSLSGVDAASFAIDTAAGQLRTLAVLDYETISSYSVTVSVSDGKDADGNADTTVDDTITVTINVTNEDEAGSVALPPAQPVVGTALTATLTDPDGSISGATWVWARSTNRLTGWTDIGGATLASYTPVAGDGGKYLRATATYTDGAGAGKSARGVSANTVVAAAQANNPPAFASDTDSRTIAENSAVGNSVGGAVTATDAGDTLTYTLSGADAASFAIGASTGQITVGTGASLDYETKASYAVTVTATDTLNATDTIAITINVTNVDTEAPGMPEAPTVSELSSTSLSVAWSEPANSGPAITDYDVQYRAGSAGNFTRWTHDGVATATTISGLAPSTEYEVQVRAISGEGMGAWSSSGTATTLAPTASPGVPIFSLSTVSVEEGSTATYQVALSVQPSGNVTLTLESSDTGALEVSPRSLTFTTSDWDVQQTVTVRGVEDSGTADETVTVTHTATGGGYDTARGILTVTVDDDDTASSGGSSGSSGSGGGGSGSSGSGGGGSGSSGGGGGGGGGVDGGGGPVVLTPVIPEGVSVIRELEENSDAGAVVGGPLNDTESEGMPLTYSLGGEDAALFSIDPGTGQITLGSGVVLDYESGKRTYTVDVLARTSTGDISKTSVTVAVTNVDEPGTIVVSPDTGLMAGATLTASLTDPDGGVTGEAWRWQHSTDGTTWTDIGGAASASYSLTTADAGMLLRAAVSYADTLSTGLSLAGDALPIVVAAPQPQPAPIPQPAPTLQPAPIPTPGPTDTPAAGAAPVPTAEPTPTAPLTPAGVVGATPRPPLPTPTPWMSGPTPAPAESTGPILAAQAPTPAPTIALQPAATPSIAAQPTRAPALPAPVQQAPPPAESQDGFPLWVSVLIIFGLGVLALGVVLIYLRRRYRPTPPGTRR